MGFFMTGEQIAASHPMDPFAAYVKLVRLLDRTKPEPDTNTAKVAVLSMGLTGLRKSQLCIVQVSDVKQILNLNGW